MAVLPVTLTVGNTAYEVGTVELLGTDEEQRKKLECFLRAVADNLKDGYTLRKVASGDLRALPADVVHTDDRRL